MATNRNKKDYVVRFQLYGFEGISNKRKVQETPAIQQVYQNESKL